MMFEIKDCLTIDILFSLFLLFITTIRSIYCFCKNTNLLSDISTYLLRKPCENDYYSHITISLGNLILFASPLSPII